MGILHPLNGFDRVVMTQASVPIDAVVIGRNEGARLVACLQSLAGQVRRLIYVDSGSTDGSVAVAQAAGAHVVALDLAQPFTAARARNAGLAVLAADPPEFVQMVDGDCAVQAGWISAAADFLLTHPKAALVFGRRRERFPDASIYNLLCDHEWNTPLGQAPACGGDLLIRWAAVDQVGGYRGDVIAAEDDEMCQRLRGFGWQLWRIDAEMTLHDAAILRFGQWWRRAVRAGHGFAQVGALHPVHFVAARRRVWLWGALLPLVFVAGLWWWPLSLVAVALYVASFLRGVLRFARQGFGLGQASKASALITLSKFPNLQGVLTYLWRRRQGAAARIIEYK